MSTLDLRAEQLSFAYQDNAVLNEIDLAIQPGELVGLIGPNGSGKSTLIKCLSRALAPQRGRVWLDGHELAALAPQQIARHIAVVPQAVELPPGFTAFEIVLMGRVPHLAWWQNENARDKDIARAAMQATQTWSLADRLVNQLSGGERQRVVIARALAQEPQILLLDEPTAHLDVKHQIEVMELVRRLNRERGLAVLVVFHDLNLAAQYCSRLVLFKEGRVYKAGSPRDVIAPDVLREVYGVELLVVPHPQNQRPMAVVGKIEG
ncbi:MAG: heme ABC transporter ATP-binding protein [Chloroflexota bacterium]